MSKTKYQADVVVGIVLCIAASMLLIGIVRATTNGTQFATFPDVSALIQQDTTPEPVFPPSIKNKYP